MKLHFLGANRQVTGSRHAIEAGNQRVLVDCGLFQEREYKRRNWEPSALAPAAIDALLLTHVHIDHSGLIPRLVREGYRGPIYCTRPTVPLADIMLRDAAEIQMEDAAYKRKRHRREHRRGPHPEVALFDEADVERTLPLLRPVPYGHDIEIGDALTARFHDAGHILGSALVEVIVREEDRERVVIFSGDLGQWDKPLVRDPTLMERADYVVMESTYGDRDHREAGDVAQVLGDAVHDAVERGGNVVIPTFAVERAQELMFHFSRLVHQRRIPSVPVFLDSPMAVDVTGVFRDFRDCLDQETWELLASNHPPLRFPGLKLVRSHEESKAINGLREPCVIMATSGMCTSGRIKHHLRQNIERPQSIILFVGYQAHGTLGRQILDRSDSVRIHGRSYRVRADVRRIYGMSAHADRADLVRWAGHFDPPPRRIFLVHGEESAARSLADVLHERGLECEVPAYGETVEV